MRKIFKILLFFLSITTPQLNVRAGDSLKNLELPIYAGNFKELEYFFDPSSSKVTVHFWEGSSAIIYSGLTVGAVDPKSRAVTFSILAKLGGEDVKYDARFKQWKDGSWTVSFNIPGFDPEKGRLIYQGEENSTRVVPYKGGAKEASARELGAASKKP